MQSTAILWYSQTGHSFRLAQTAEKALREKGTSARVENMRRETGKLPSEDLLIFSFPVFNWNLPWPVRDFLSAMPEPREKKQALLILTMGGWAANTPYIFQRALAEKNIELRNFVCVRCRDSYIPFAKWLPFMDKKELPDEGSFARVRAFVESAAGPGSKRRKAVFNPFDPMHWIGAATPKDGSLMFMGPRQFVKERCTGCGFCLTLCPGQAIEGSGRDLSWDREKCIGCCGCINICPENAWRLTRFPEDSYNKGLDVARMVADMKRK
ncbi:MAG: EFR1 family ferrodoxin [Thermodesulfobacteriota bacterium]